MKIDIRFDLDPLLRLTNGLRRQVRFAVRRAINETLKDAKSEVGKNLNSSLDRPTPWTMRGIGIEWANKANLQGRITLGTLGRAGVTTHHVIPGTRPSKGMEIALRAKGLLPTGMYVVPTSAAPRDAYGNVPRALIGQIMAALHASKTSGSARAGRVRKKLGKAGIEYFVGRPGRNLPAGIWEKRQFGYGSGIRPLFLFVDAVRYRERVPFHDVVLRTVEAKFAAHFARALEDAVRSAK